MKTALILGVSGQDGALLARLLLTKNYRVVGTTRRASSDRLPNIVRLGIADRVEVEHLMISEPKEVVDLIERIRPIEIYNLAGQSSAILSFETPLESFDSISNDCLRLLEAIRRIDMPIRFYNAGSSECFGNTGEFAATETTPFHPRNPYAIAKVAAFWQVVVYRQVHGLYACTGITFSHESPLRTPNFFSRKVACAVREIAAGRQRVLELGDLSAQRDWGWAPEYVEAMWQMLQMQSAEDFVIATGETHSLEEFVQEAFSVVGLDWRKYVRLNTDLRRPADITVCRADPSRIAKALGWKAGTRMRRIVESMINEDI